MANIASLLSGISSLFGEAGDLIKLGAEAYSAISGDDDKDTGFMKPNFAGFRTSAASVRPMEMDSPYGIRQPVYPENIQSAMRSMAQRQLTDTTLQQVRDVAAVRRTRTNISPNIGMSYDMDITPAGARAAQVSRARIRNTLGA